MALNPERLSVDAEISAAATEFLRTDSVRQLSGHDGLVLDVAIAPDGRNAVSGGYDKTVRIWDIETGHNVRTLEGHTGCIYGVAITPDGKWIASYDDNSVVRLWEFATGRAVGLSGEGETSSWVGHAAAFHPNGSLLATRGGASARPCWWARASTAVRRH